MSADLMAVLAAKQLGAERIIAMSRHPERQKLAHYYGATDIVEERGDEGVSKIKELTGGLGAHSVVEAVGTQESFMQAVGATRLPDLVQLICDRKIDPGKVFDLTLPLEQVAEGYKAMDERRATKVMLTL